jgi:hypothetical protein
MLTFSLEGHLYVAALNALQNKLGSWPNGIKLGKVIGVRYRKFIYLQFGNVVISTLLRA